MKVGDLVRSPSGDIGVVIQVGERIRVMFHYGDYDLPRSNLGVVSEGR